VDVPKHKQAVAGDVNSETLTVKEQPSAIVNQVFENSPRATNGDDEQHRNGKYATYAQSRNVSEVKYYNILIN